MVMQPPRGLDQLRKCQKGVLLVKPGDLTSGDLLVHMDQWRQEIYDALCRLWLKIGDSRLKDRWGYLLPRPTGGVHCLDEHLCSGGS